MPTAGQFAAIRAEINGSLPAIRVLWAEMRARAADLTVRDDIVEDFLVDAMAETARLGLLEEFLFRLLSAGLTTGAPFRAAARAALGHDPTGTRSPGAGESAAPRASSRADLLEMMVGDASALNGASEPPATSALLPAEYQPFWPKDADSSEEGMHRAIDRVCRIVIDGDTRGSGVLVSSGLVATSAHVVEPLVLEQRGKAKGEFRARPHSLRRLSILFPRATRGGFEGAASLHPDWLGYYSPAAKCERIRPFDVYDFSSISDREGPWDIALIRLAEPPPHVRGDVGGVRADTPEFRFSLNVLHCPGDEDDERERKTVWHSAGQYLGRVSQQHRLRLLHDAVTEPGSSGAPCFNSDWQIVAIHQGGAYVPETRRKVNRAVPIGPWVKQVPTETPVVWQKSVPSVDAVTPQPVIGRRHLQRRIHWATRGDAAAVDRLFVIRGSPGRGKSFSLRLLGHLREKGHFVSVLDLEGVGGIDDARFAGLVLGTLGHATSPPAHPGLSRHEKEVLNATLPMIVDQLTATAREHPIWLAFDSFHSAGLIEDNGVAQLVDGLIKELPKHPQLRLMLADWTRPLPPDFADAVEDLDDPGAWPGVEDFVDYVALLRTPAGAEPAHGERNLIRGLLAPSLNPILQSGAPGPHHYAALLAAAQPVLDLMIGGI
jgi:trypsin-like peptidase